MSEHNFLKHTNSEFVKETKLFQIYHHSLNLPSTSFHDLLPVSLGDQSSPLALLTTLPMPLENKLNPSWTFFENQIIPDFFNYKEGFIHARNVLQDYFSNLDKKDLIVFDHGYDLPPFPGGKLRYFKNNGQQFIYDPTFFDYPESFNFGGFSGDWDNDGFAELFICNLSNNSPLYFKNDNGKKLTAANNRLPEIITQNFFQVLSGSKFKDHSGKLHMALGSSGGPQRAKSDLVLINSGDGHFLSKDIVYLPERRGGADWSAIAIAPLHSQQNTFSNLLVNYHDANTQNGLIDIYIQKSNQKFGHYNDKSSLYEEADCWFPRLDLCSISKDQAQDVIAIKSRGLKKHVAKELNVVFLVDDGGIYTDHSEELLPLSSREFIGFLEIKKSNGPSDIIFMEHSGNYFYCKRK